MDNDRWRIDELLDVLSTARIYAGAEMEVLCNEKKYSEALYFNGLRDFLDSQIKVIESFYK